MQYLCCCGELPPPDLGDCWFFACDFWDIDSDDPMSRGICLPEGTSATLSGVIWQYERFDDGSDTGRDNRCDNLSPVERSYFDVRFPEPIDLVSVGNTFTATVEATVTLRNIALLAEISYQSLPANINRVLTGIEYRITVRREQAFGYRCAEASGETDVGVRCHWRIDAVITAAGLDAALEALLPIFTNFNDPEQVARRVFQFSASGVTMPGPGSVRLTECIPQYFVSPVRTRVDEVSRQDTPTSSNGRMLYCATAVRTSILFPISYNMERAWSFNFTDPRVCCVTPQPEGNSTGTNEVSLCVKQEPATDTRCCPEQFNQVYLRLREFIAVCFSCLDFAHDGTKDVVDGRYTQRLTPYLIQRLNHNASPGGSIDEEWRLRINNWGYWQDFNDDPTDVEDVGTSPSYDGSCGSPSWFRRDAHWDWVVQRIGLQVRVAAETFVDSPGGGFSDLFFEAFTEWDPDCVFFGRHPNSLPGLLANTINAAISDCDTGTELDSTQVLLLGTGGVLEFYLQT